MLTTQTIQITHATTPTATRDTTGTTHPEHIPAPGRRGARPSARTDLTGTFPELAAARAHLAAVVALLPLADTDGSLEILRAEEAGYQRVAASLPGRVIGFNNAVNAALAGRRAQMSAKLTVADAELATHDATSGTDASVPEGVRSSARSLAANMAWRLRRELEHLTTLTLAFNAGLTGTYVRPFLPGVSQATADDIEAAATLGLMTAIDTFNPAKGSFGSWAYVRIQREVLNAVRFADHAHLSHGDFEARPKILAAREQLAGHGTDRREPSVVEIAAATGFTTTLIERVLTRPAASLDAPTRSDVPDSASRGELIAQDGPGVDTQVIGALRASVLTQVGLSVLDDRQRYVLNRRYGLDGSEPGSGSEIGKELGLSREGVRQIEARAMARLLHPVTLRRLVRDGRR